MKIPIRKPIVIFLAIFVTFSGAYSIKTHLGIDAFRQYHLSTYFPFKYLLPTVVIDEPELDYYRVESFEKINPFGFWRGIYSEKKNIAKRQYDLKGYDQGKSLTISASHQVFWAINGGYYIKVSPGDTFSFEAKINLENPVKNVGIGVISYIEERKSPRYSFVVKKADTTIIKQWQTVSTNFAIPVGIHYIMLRIWGVTNGKVRFDDIKVRRRK